MLKFLIAINNCTHSEWFRFWQFSAKAPPGWYCELLFASHLSSRASARVLTLHEWNLQQCTHLHFVYVIWNDYCPHSTRTRTWKVLQKARKLVLRSTSTLRRSFKLPLLGLVGYVTTASLCSHCTQFDFSESTESASLRLRAYALGVCLWRARRRGGGVNDCRMCMAMRIRICCHTPFLSPSPFRSLFLPLSFSLLL